MLKGKRACTPIKWVPDRYHVLDCMRPEYPLQPLNSHPICLTNNPTFCDLNKTLIVHWAPLQLCQPLFIGLIWSHPNFPSNEELTQTLRYTRMDEFDSC